MHSIAGKVNNSALLIGTDCVVYIRNKTVNHNQLTEQLAIAIYCTMHGKAVYLVSSRVESGSHLLTHLTHRAIRV